MIVAHYSQFLLNLSDISSDFWDDKIPYWVPRLASTYAIKGSCCDHLAGKASRLN